MEDVEEGAHDLVLSAEEARADGINIPRAPPVDPVDANVRPPCIWQQRRQKRVTDGRQYLLEHLGFDDDDVEEEEDEEGYAHTTSRTNPFVLLEAGVARGRKRRHLLDDDVLDD